MSVRNSVMTPNGLAGSMGLNGMSVLIATRKRFPNVAIVETHPKVLYWALSRQRHNYSTTTKSEMDRMLAEAHAVTLSTANEHEWDAALSALAAVRGVLGVWRRDLHALPPLPEETLVRPCGHSTYFWPDA
jgi:hypothetical protein